MDFVEQFIGQFLVVVNFTVELLNPCIFYVRIGFIDDIVAL